VKHLLIVLALFGVLIFVSPMYAQITFERWYGGTSSDEGYSVAQTSDGGYIVAGRTISFGAGFGDVYLIKTDANGDTLWTRTYGGTDWDDGRSVAQTFDGGYIIAGWTESYGVGPFDVYLIKTDSSGDTLWTRTYGGVGYDWGFSVAQTSDSGYIISGMTDSYGAGSSDVYLIKTDTNGDTLWTRTYGGTYWDMGESVAQTSDSGYIIAGKTLSYGAGHEDVYLIKTDFLGDTLWTRTYGGTLWDAGNSVGQTFDGGYIVTGYTYSYGVDSGDVYLIKTDANGDTIWTRTYGGTSSDGGYSVVQTSDGGYIISGWTNSYGAGSDDVYLIKTDANGLVGIQEEEREVTLFPRLVVSPNPFTSEIKIQMTEIRGQDLLRIYDISGREVRNFSIPNSQLPVVSIVWDGRDNKGCNVLPGIYFIMLKSGDFTSVKKFILVR